LTALYAALPDVPKPVVQLIDVPPAELIGALSPVISPILPVDAAAAAQRDHSDSTVVSFTVARAGSGAAGQPIELFRSSNGELAHTGNLGVSVDPVDGSLVVPSYNTARVVRLCQTPSASPAGTWSCATMIGGGAAAEGPADTIELKQPTSLSFSADGASLFVSDPGLP
jgi:hypothetical protein